MTEPNIRIRTRGLPNVPETAATTRSRDLIWGSDLQIENLLIDQLKMPRRQLRKHTKSQLCQLAANIREFGFLVPATVDDDDRIVTGAARVAAARDAGLDRIPVVRLSHLTEAQRRAFAIADNRLAELSNWDDDLLTIELSELSEIDLDFDFEMLGFNTTQLDIIIGDRVADAAINDGCSRGDDSAANDNADEDCSANNTDVADADDDVAISDEPPVSRMGDCWQLGSHKLLCGDARSADDYIILMGPERGQMVIADPPYNVHIGGNVCGLGSVTHAEFAMASGEMSRAEFTEFLRASCANLANFSADGSIHFIFMDWRHMRELQDAGYATYAELKNLIVWNKSNAGMGAFYRSKHELIFVWKHGTAPHINNFGLGGSGRYRTNVWDYPGITSVGPDRLEQLAMHPTVKPVAMIADAIKDCSRRGGIILDPFCGAGTTIIAAERTGRVARCIEYEPKFVDVAVRRWERATGLSATLITTGADFAAVAAMRADERSAA